MESDHNETSATCTRCKQRPATSTYANRGGKWTEQVCDPCLDILQLQETFNWGMIEIRKTTEQERYDKILTWLDAFEKANHHRDQDGWLARGLAGYRELTLWEAGRYEEAMRACDTIEQLGFKNVTDRWGLAGFRARNFEGMERHAEALAVFEEAFRHQDPRYLASARYWMRPLVEYSANAGKPVDESWREVVQNVANEFDVEMPVRDSLGETILALFDLTENKPSKRQRGL